MARNKIIRYNSKLRQRAKDLRNNSTLGEILLWNQIKKKKMGVQFHRQVPLDQFIVDFYRHEIQMAIEIDGNTHDNPQQKAKDLERQYRLEQLGVHFVRITDRDVKKNLDSVIQYIIQEIREVIQQKQKSNSTF